MKKRRLISLILILLIVFISLSIVYTNAKYTSTVNGNVTTSVAKYVFNVTGTDSYNSTDTIENLTLAQTCDEKTLVNGKIAPGTQGDFDIVVDTSGAEVGINYEVTFSNNSEHALPKNLIFTLDGEVWNFDKKITGTIDANAENKIVNHTVLWCWSYETADDEGNTIIGDMLDTNDGKNAFDYSFTVTATGTQAKPLLEGEEPQPIHKHNYDNLIGKTIIDNKVYCDDDCDGIDVTVIVENNTVKINNVIYNISNNVIVDKHTVHTYEGATLIPNGSSYKIACTECKEEITGIKYENNGEVTIGGNTYSVTEDTKVIGNKIASYVVKHWQQNVNGVAEQYDENNYTKYETKTYTGTTGTSVIAKLEEYEGFITPEEQSAIIFGNGGTVIDYYYVRNVTVDSIAFITEWTLTSDNTTITLPIKTAPNITIDWGDGTVEEKSSTDPKHTYINAGVYNIRITGNLPSWDFERHSAYSHKDNNYITGITQWGEVGFTSVNFYGCSKLKNIPEPTEHSFDSVIDFSNLFNNCTGLEGNIPENLFKNCTGLTSANINNNKIQHTFEGCTNLTDIILGDNVSLIYTNSFYVPSNTQTVITTNNDVVLNYDWSADNRTVTFK